MAQVKDEAEHAVKEGDWVVFPNQTPLSRGRVVSIGPIMQRGPYHGGTHIKIVHEIDFMMPPGHMVMPVHVVPPNEEEKKKTEAALSGNAAPVPSLLAMP